MYRGFKLTIPKENIAEDTSNEFYKKGVGIFENAKTIVHDKLKNYLLDSDILNGSKMREDWFPEIKADIFLSHSHVDQYKAIVLAGAFSEIGLTTFIDSCVWGYADDLLKKIDKKYCYQEFSNTYSYPKRNQSTSHVHMMLNTSLMNMMDKCECLILLNTPNSVQLSDIKDEKTLSPWIYSEMSTSKLIRKQTPQRRKERRIKYIIEGGNILNKAVENLVVEYDVDSSHLANLDLDIWEISLNKGNIKAVGKAALDALYDSHPLRKN